MSEAGGSLFRFAQFEFPWALGPPDGRYLLRDPHSGPEGPPSRVLALATLGAPQRRLLGRMQRARPAEPEPEPTPVTTGRATLIDVSEPLLGEDDARQWLSGAGEDYLLQAVSEIDAALHAYRLATEDAYLGPVSRAHALVARIGFGAGEQVAEGRWRSAREIEPAALRRRRSRALAAQARLAAILARREDGLVAEELNLRARLDLDRGRGREAALQVLIALDAALAELGSGTAATAVGERLEELRAQREDIRRAAQSALAGPLTPDELTKVTLAQSRVAAALRARAALDSRSPE